MPCTARNPNDIDRMVVSTEPMTEKKPFTAHAHATYSSGVVGQAADHAEAERHEHAEAEAERRRARRSAMSDADREALVEQSRR